MSVIVYLIFCSLDEKIKPINENLWTVQSSRQGKKEESVWKVVA
jgi:hypothetical protein